MKPGVPPTPEQCVEFRRRLGVDLLITNNIRLQEDSLAVVEWQACLQNISWRRSCPAWRRNGTPHPILRECGLEATYGRPLWFGGAYLFGVSMRPVRMEGRAS